MKYTPRYLKKMANIAISAKEAGDERYLLLISEIQNRTGLPRGFIYMLILGLADQ